MPKPEVIGVDWNDAPLERLADRLIADHRGRLPRLDGVLVLMPEMDAAPQLRRLLLERAGRQGHAALLGPRIQRLSDWLAGYCIGEQRLLDRSAAELMLVEALDAHRDLFGGANLWALSDSLLELFDEMTRRRVSLPSRLDAFTACLRTAYRTIRPPTALEREARLVHTLWQAWHEQLEARGCIDGASAYLLRLAASASAPDAANIYITGMTELNGAEQQWLEELAGRLPTCVFIHGATDGESSSVHPATVPSVLLRQLGADPPRVAPKDPFSRFLDTSFAGYLEEAEQLAERAGQLARDLPEEPVAGRLALLPAAGAEMEARAIEIQVRRWLLDGCRHVAVVTENRKLARRVRALLERAGVAVHDRGGWALSTTSAAAVLERWLECIEEDFPYLALLDLLKSPFFASGHERDRHLETVYRLERDIIHHENVGRGAAAYRRRVKYRRPRVPESAWPELARVDELLTCLEQAAAPLTAMLHERLPPAAFLSALIASLRQLGIEPHLEADPAGIQLLGELERMRRAADTASLRVEWGELRAWIGSTLERAHFRPPVGAGPVLMAGLSQSIGHFDALVLAGAERAYLPGSPGSSPFFNDAVRSELGLATSTDRQALAFYHFRRLLQAAPRVLITFRDEQNGEPIEPSPWVESLRTVHRLAWGGTLEDGLLAQLASSPQAEVADRTSPLPGRERQPAPTLPATLLPDTFSPSAYQQLMDCPYLFFAARGLRLAPPDTIREALEKSDFGERVHRCLEAFHAGVEGLPGPFAAPATPSNRPEAIALLERIAEAVFARDLEDNFLHRGWLERWRTVIPAYIDWQWQRAECWQATGAELTARADLGELALEGRLDRVDHSPEGLGVVDYKTGVVPAEEAVLAGEAVQLPCYALLAAADTGQPVARVEYLEIGRERVTSRAVLEGAELAGLAEGVGQRLRELSRELGSGSPLPAWGSDGVCAYCRMDGLCRRQAWWQDEPAFSTE